MSESNPIGYNDMFTPDAWEKFIANLEKTKALLGDVNSGLTAISRNKVGDVSGAGSGKKTTADEIKKENDAIAKINATYEAKIKLMKEEASIDKQILQFKNDLAKADKADADAKKKIAEEIKKENAQNKESIRLAQLKDKILTSQKGSYDQLSAKLAYFTKLSNKMSEADRQNTQTGKYLTAQKLALRNQLISLDEATNLHVRKVGHYELALNKLGKGAKGLTGLLVQLGSAFGFDTEMLEKVEGVGKSFAKTLKEIHHVEGLGNVIKQENVVLTEEQIVATEAQTAVTEQQTVATEAQTVAERILNQVRMMNPALLAVAAGLALIAVVTAIAVALRGQTKAEIDRTRATDGTIIKSKELREEYNKHLSELQKMENEYAVLTGTMNEFAAEMDNLQIEYRESVSKIVADTNEKIDKVGGFWKELFGGVGEQINVMVERGEVAQEGFLKIQMESEKLAERQKILREKERQEREKEKEEILKSSQELGRETRMLNAESIRNERERERTILQINTQASITDVENTKASEQAKAEARAAIWNYHRFQLAELQEKWRNEDAEKEKKHNERMRKLYQEDRDAKLKAEKEKYDLIDRLRELHDANLSEKSEMETETERYEAQKNELESIAEAARQKGVFNQEKYDRELESIETNHQYKMNQIYGDMRAKTDAEIEKADKEKAEKDKAAREKQLKDLISFEQQILNNLKDSLSKQSKLQQDALNQRTAQIDAESQIQSQLLIAGEENTLDFQRQERAKAYAEQAALDKKKRKDEENLQLANLYLEFQKVYAKEGLQGAVKAFAQTMAAKGIANQIAGSAEDGVEDTGDANGNGVDGKGGAYWILHPNERVIPKVLNEKIDGMSNEELVNKAWAFDNIYDQNKITEKQTVGNYSSEMLILNGLNNVANAIAEIETTIITADDLNQIVENKLKRGIRSITTYKEPVLNNYIPPRL